MSPFFAGSRDRASLYLYYAQRPASQVASPEVPQNDDKAAALPPAVTEKEFPPTPAQTPEPFPDPEKQLYRSSPSPIPRLYTPSPLEEEEAFDFAEKPLPTPAQTPEPDMAFAMTQLGSRGMVSAQ